MVPLTGLMRVRHWAVVLVGGLADELDETMERKMAASLVDWMDASMAEWWAVKRVVV